MSSENIKELFNDKKVHILHDGICYHLGYFREVRIRDDDKKLTDRTKWKVPMYVYYPKLNHVLKDVFEEMLRRDLSDKADNFKQFRQSIDYALKQIDVIADSLRTKKMEV